MDMEVERAIDSLNGLRMIEPATFRGVDCAELAQRYAVYLRNKELDEARDSADVIRPATPSSENV